MGTAPATVGAAGLLGWSGRQLFEDLPVPRSVPQPRLPARSPSHPARVVARRFGGLVARFLHIEAAGALALLAATAVALVWANSPWSGAYQRLWHRPLAFSIAGVVSTRTLQFWVNDGLMSVFFLVVGLEVRREMHEGALASRRLAMLPVAAALGGMIAPALTFLAIGHGPLLWRAWAVPTATDIAFAVGVLALLGSRVPRPLRALLLALAIIDDIGTVVIIAFGYSNGLSPASLAVVAAASASVIALARLRLRGWPIYVAAGVVIWIGLLRSGVHPTLAGVILGFLVPVSDSRSAPPQSVSLSVRLSNALHPWVAYGIMPIFALANAGIDFHGLALDGAAQSTLAAGIAASLVLGKPLGITLATFACLRLDLCALPRGVTMKGILLVGCLGGIGFTLSIFVAGLAFADEALLRAAKLGILLGSAAAALTAVSVSRLLLPRSRAAPARATAGTSMAGTSTAGAAADPESNRRPSPRS